MSQSRWRGWSRWCRTWRGEFEEGEIGEAERELEEKTGRWRRLLLLLRLI
jgi:hypothetical protein